MRRLLLALILAVPRRPGRGGGLSADRGALGPRAASPSSSSTTGARRCGSAIRRGSRCAAASRGLRGVQFSTGTIEFDLLLEGNRDFAGFSFRDQGDGNGELFYVRPHQNGNPDATQYTPVVNGSPAWQIFTDEGYTSAVRFTTGALDAGPGRRLRRPR